MRKNFLRRYNLTVLNLRLQRRVLVSLGLTVMAVVVVLGLALAYAVQSYFQAADYPGALLISDHSLYRVTPAFHYRRDTSYRSTDAFPRLYNWYSSRFRLGPEARAISACITLEKSDAVLVIERTTTVMLCDSGDDRMVFVTRSLTWRYR